MCVTKHAATVSARDAIEAYASRQTEVNAIQDVYVWFYSNDNGEYSVYPESASRILVEQGFTNDLEYVEYVFNQMAFVVYFDRINNKIVQINRNTGQTRLLSRCKVTSPLVIKLKISLLATTHVWKVESKNVDDPEPYNFYADGQADLDAAYSLFKTGGSHIYGHENLVINFERMIQTSIPNQTVSKLYRVPFTQD